MISLGRINRIHMVALAAVLCSAGCGEDGASPSGGGETGEDARGGGGGEDARDNSDSGRIDTGDGDGGTHSDGGSDAGQADSGIQADSGGRDGGPADAGPRDAGSGDSGVVDDSPRLVQGLTIREVAFFQAVKVSLGKGGVAVQDRNAAVVAGREALVRVYFDLGSGWKSQSVTAEAVVDTGGKREVFTATLSPSAPSVEESLSSTFNVRVPGGKVAPGAAISVRLTAANGVPTPSGIASDARFPADGSYLGLDARSTGGPIDLVLVPMRYDTDGSGRLPDTGPHVLQTIERLLTTVYPADGVAITVRDPLPWNEDLTWSGGVDFNKLNQYIADIKEQDGAPSGSYYYGMIKPKGTFGEYCSWACVTGQGWVVDDPADGAIRAASGVAFDVDQTAWTCAHETGHLHGRYHAPCSTVDSDQNYPYSGGKIGVWGWDGPSNLLYSPDT
ncbi:MAG: hypothetical protein HY897_06740 [Deltaproteobacteria bacterium]|nr:hypothetical protein [Deltaproteobacteria bacterium]